MTERHRRIRRRRPHLRDRPRRRSGDAGAVGQRDRQPALRHDPQRERIGDDVVREQPREPADAVRERSGDRSRRRGAVHSRRRYRPRVVADAGTDAAIVGERAHPDPPRGRPDALLAIVRGHSSSARGLRRRRGSGALRAADARQHVAEPAAPERVRLQRLGDRSAARARHASRHHRLRRAASGGPRVESVQHHVLGTRLLRGVQRAADLGDRQSPIVPRPQRIDGQAVGARRREPDRRIRRRHGSVRGDADSRRARARRNAQDGVPARRRHCRARTRSS